MKLAVDFDSVIHDPYNVRKGYKMGQPVAGAGEAIRQLKRQGHTIVIFPVWADTEKKRQAIVGWLTYFNVPFDDITSTKPDADVYVDDRGYRFVSWEETVRFLKVLEKAHQESQAHEGVERTNAQVPDEL